MEERLPDAPMICLICRDAQTVAGFTTVQFERDEFKAIVHQIPAQVCPVCGEAFLNEETTTDLLKKVEQIFEEGEMDVVQNYV